MKIYGPYTYVDKSGRQRQLINIVDGDRKRSQSYPRYLLEQHLGRKLGDDEDCDHIDRDTMNNDISNLRVLPRRINRGRHIEAAAVKSFECVHCGQLGARLARKLRERERLGKAGPFCDRKCARHWQIGQSMPR